MIILRDVYSMFCFMKNRKFFLFSAVVLSVSIVSGCASKKLKPVGFIHDYQNVIESDDRDGLFVDKTNIDKISSYKKIIIDPVVVVFSDDAKGLDVSEGQVRELSGFLNGELSKAFLERFEVVDAPGEGVLLLRTAITDVIPSKVYLNLHWSTTATGLGVGGAAMEAEFVDSVSKERILAVVDSRKGKRVKYFNGLSKWKHTQDVFKQWAKMLNELVE